MPGAAAPEPPRPDSDYVLAPDLLSGAVLSAVGYASTGMVPGLHRGLPSPHLTFIFSLDAPVVSGPTPDRARGPQADRNAVLVAGLHPVPTYVIQPSEQAGVQLSVHPLAARRVFGVPAAEIPTTATEGVDLLGRESERIHQQLGEEPSWAGRFSILSRYLRALSDRRRPEPVRPELAEAWRWLAQRRGAGSVQELAAHVALSPRQLRAVFQRELGLSPKRVGRLMRFDAAKQLLAVAVASGQPLSLTDLASSCGFSDHPHLDAEFRQFAQVSPSAWVAEERRNIQAGGHRQGQDWRHDQH